MRTTHFYQIKAGYCLHIPGVQDPNSKVWGKPGWFVDLSDPSMMAFAEGQMQKLVKVESFPSGSQVAVQPRILANRIKEAERAASGEKPQTKVEQDVEASGVDLDALPPITRKKRPAKKAPTKSAPAAGESNNG
jgi:hypothetical protein